VKILIKIMNKESQLRGSNVFTKSDMQLLCSKLSLDGDIDGLIDVMRSECYLLMKGKGIYQLLTSSS